MGFLTSISVLTVVTVLATLVSWLVILIVSILTGIVSWLLLLIICWSWFVVTATKRVVTVGIGVSDGFVNGGFQFGSYIVFAESENFPENIFMLWEFADEVFFSWVFIFFFVYAWKKN